MTGIKLNGLVPVNNAQGVAESFDDSDLPLVVMCFRELPGQPAVLVEKALCKTWSDATGTANLFAACMHPLFHRLYAIPFKRLQG